MNLDIRGRQRRNLEILDVRITADTIATILGTLPLPGDSIPVGGKTGVVASQRIDSYEACVAIGAAGIACLLALVIDRASGPRHLPVGIVERGAVYSIVIWEIMTGAAILCRRP